VRVFIEREHALLCRLIAVQIDKLAARSGVTDSGTGQRGTPGDGRPGAPEATPARFEVGRAVLPWPWASRSTSIRNRFRRCGGRTVRPVSTLTTARPPAVFGPARPGTGPSSRGPRRPPSGPVPSLAQAREAIEQRYSRARWEDLARALRDKPRARGSVSAALA